MNDPRMQSIAMPSALVPAEIRTGLEEDFSDKSVREIEELKHSIRTHILLMNGVNDQLGAFLLKLIDFLTDTDEVRRLNEISQLAYTIAEAASIYVSGVIDSHIQKFESESRDVNEALKDANDDILVQIGKWRSKSDKMSAKYAVLKALASALMLFSSETGIQYPQITDVNGVPL